MSFTYDNHTFASSLNERDSKGEFESFYVPRIEMPQIENTKALGKALAKKFGHNISVCKADVRDLHQHQRVVMNRAAEQKIPADKMAQPIVISSDNFVVDGNHRYRAHLDRHEFAVNAIRMPMKFADALNWLATQDFVSHSAPQAKGE